MFKLDINTQSKIDHNAFYDVIIIGAGSAGLTTAIYTARDGWKTLILEKEASGGLAASTHLIENYPGFPEGIEGPDLMEKFEEQARRFGADMVEFEEVLAVEKRDDEIFEVKTNADKIYQGRTVLLATGSLPKKLGIPGEEEFYNRGVSYCATCDGPLYSNQDVVVVGCGNSGLQEAQILLEYARSVTFVEFLPHSIAEKVLQDRVVNNPKTTCKFSHMITEVKGGNTVSSVVVKNRETDDIEDIPTAAVFIYVGYQPYTSFVAGWIDLDELGYVTTDKKMHTSVPGVFAAGDVRSDNLAQVAVAVGDGAKAAVAIREYLQEHTAR